MLLIYDPHQRIDVFKCHTILKSCLLVFRFQNSSSTTTSLIINILFLLFFHLKKKRVVLAEVGQQQQQQHRKQQKQPQRLQKVQLRREGQLMGPAATIIRLKRILKLQNGYDSTPPSLPPSLPPHNTPLTGTVVFDPPI